MNQLALFISALDVPLQISSAPLGKECWESHLSFKWKAFYYITRRLIYHCQSC